MANAYGTNKYKEYIDSYSQFDYRLQEGSSFTVEDIQVFVKAFTWEDEKTMRRMDKAEYLFKFKDGKEYKTDVVDVDAMRKVCIVYIQGVRYLFFKKALYGYCFLNLETFEEINYFPSAVVEGGEAYIIVDAFQFQDILLFDGCYWGGGYFVAIMDLNTFKVAETDIGINSERPFKIDGDILWIENEEGNTLSFTRQQLKEQIKLNGKNDI